MVEIVLLVSVLLLMQAVSLPWLGGLLSGLGSYFGAKESAESSDEQYYNNLRLSADAVKRMREAWQKGYDLSGKEFDYARQSILGREMSNMGTAMAGLASSGLLNTTASLGAARGVRQDTNMALGQLAAQQSASEYGKWLDLAEIESNLYDENAGGKGAPWGLIMGAGLNQPGLLGGKSGLDWTQMLWGQGGGG